MEQIKEEKIREAVDNRIKEFAKNLETRYIKELHDPNGVINSKKKNVFIKPLGDEFIFNSAFCRSFDSSFGNVLEALANDVASVSFDVITEKISSFLLPQQTQHIDYIMADYEKHAKTPEISDYSNFDAFIPSNTSSYVKSHVTDNHFYNPKTKEHYIIELKAGGDLDNKKAKSEKMELLKEYFILKNELVGTEESVLSIQNVNNIMRKLLLAFCAFATICSAGAQWKPAGDKIKTDWAEKVDPRNVLPEYPRPGMERADWQNLNGEWEYAILPKGQVEPTSFDGNILVPFAVESSLSGVQKEVGEKNELWYKRTFTVPSSWKGKDILLNFGAVDWKADVFVNDILIGSHTGGFTPFSLNITPYLNGKSTHKLVVRVWDPSDKGYQPRGKQVADPEGIWYTPVTGIWQTVWLEPVASSHITSIKAIPNIDNGVMSVTVGTCSDSPVSDIVEVSLLDKGQVVATAKGVQGKELRLAVKNPTLWEPSNPYLYDMKVSLSKNGKKVDEVKSYTAFRKISAERDANGIMRMRLNNKNLFQYGPLDQGWWPDGLYTAPTDEALLYDIVKTKAWGFNMIRKHVKVEPARWYYHCDKEGMLVWQDMPSGDMGNQWAPHTYNGGTDKERTEESIRNYYKEWKEIMDLCVSNPSVVVWVPFNEAWGQFDTEKAAEWTKTYDPSRLVNPASGGNFRACGDILDLHNYPGPAMYLFDPVRVNVLGEYGGIGLAVENHLWWNKRNWGYVQFKNSDEVTAEYVKYARELKKMVPKGFSAAVYTQTTDVEGEVNGLMTYDRKVIKINEAEVRKANQEVIKALSE